MIHPLKVFLSVRKWEMLLLNIIWVKCTKIVIIMPKLWNGIENQPNKEMLMLNIIWEQCTKMVEVFLKTMPKL